MVKTETELGRYSLCTLAFFTAAIAAASAARAQNQNATAILNKAKQAAGGSGWDSVQSLYIKSRIQRCGLAGVSEEWEDVRTGNYISSYRLGMLSGTHAFDGEVVWAEDEGGQFRIVGDRASREAAVNEAFQASLSYWFPTRVRSHMEYVGSRREGTNQYTLINITPFGGSAFVLWIDSATYLIRRLVAGTQTTEFMSYRPVHGITLPFLIRVTMPANYTEEAVLQEIRVNPRLEPTKFRFPQHSRQDFSIGSGKTGTTVSFELENNFIYVPVKINGRGPLRALLDTGGGASLSSKEAKKLKLTPWGACQVVGAGEKSVDTGFVKVKSLQIGDSHLRDQIFRVFPDANGLPDVMVGYEVFMRFVVDLDHKHRKLNLTLPERFTYSSEGKVVPFRFNDRMPEIDGSVDGLAGVFTVDTGFNGPLTLTSPFVARHNLLAKLDGTQKKEVQGSGVGGKNRIVPTQVQLLKIGGVEVSDIVALLSLDTSGSNANPYIAGYLGEGVLGRFHVVFDYPSQRIILYKID